MDTARGPSLWTRLGPLVPWAVLPLLAGVLLSLLIPRPIIGMIYLDDAIYPGSARDLIAQIDYARTHSQVRAVVLVLDSPGGTVADTEAVYLELAGLRERKPVVSMAKSMAASGAYYLAAGTDFIVASPSSEVGNIGVITQLPSAPSISEDEVSTGPYKLWGAPRDTQVREMEMIKQGFYQAVRLGRGSALKATADTILRGEIWPGAEALRLGLVDDLGTISTAIDRAARLAHVAHARVADLRELAGLPTALPSLFFFETPEGVRTPYPRSPGLYLLYIPPADGRQP
jgi:protease-4